MNQRAQGAITTSRAFLVLAVGAIVYFIVDRVTDPVLNRAANETTNATANQATMWFRDGVQLIPVFILVLVFIGAIVVAVYEREVLR